MRHRHHKDLQREAAVLENLLSQIAQLWLDGRIDHNEYSSALALIRHNFETTAQRIAFPEFHEQSQEPELRLVLTK